MAADVVEKKKAEGSQGALEQGSKVKLGKGPNSGETNPCAC
jgi:hypothetical protein